MRLGTIISRPRTDRRHGAKSSCLEALLLSWTRDDVGPRMSRMSGSIVSRARRFASSVHRSAEGSAGNLSWGGRHDHYHGCRGRIGPALTIQGSLHPPNATATPTSKPPTTTIEKPVGHGGSPAQCPNAYPHRNNIRMAIALEIRSANLGSFINVSGTTTGNVVRKTIRQTASAPYASRAVRFGLAAGSG